MKFFVDLEQRNFFRKAQAIEFEDLLSSDELAFIDQEVKSALLKALSPRKQKTFSPKEAFLAGRDLWRSSDRVKKLITKQKLVAIAYELMQEKPIRLGFDQILPKAEELPLSEPYYPLFGKPSSYQDISSVSNLLCILILCLSGQGEKPDFESGDPFPSKPGNGVYLTPEFQVDFEKLRFRENQTFLVIGYTRQFSQYLLVEKDPQGHALKKLGYVFGDKLHDRLHPVLLR